MALEQNMNRHIRQCLVVARILFLVGIGLTVAGGALEGSDTVSDALTGLKLVKTGYIIVVVFVACLLAVQIYFWTQRSYLSATSKAVRVPPGHDPSVHPSFTTDIFFSDTQRHSAGYTVHYCSHLISLSVCIPAI